MAEIQINNIEELEKQFNKVSEKVIEKVSQKVLNLLRDYIDRDIYAGQNLEYFHGTQNPTKEFYNAFQLDEIKKTSNQISRELFYNWQTMGTSNFESGFWGSHVDIHNKDVREDLASFLNINGKPGISPKSRKAFWDNFLKDLDTKYVKWFEEEFSKYGITLSSLDIGVN